MSQQFFDDNNAVANGAIDGGSGPWNNATTNWTNADGTSNAAYDSTAGTITVFGSSGTGTPPTGGTVTVDADGGPALALTGTVEFQATGDNSIYTITGDDLAVASGGTSFDVIDVTGNANTDAIISSVIDGSDGITKTGVGTLTLSDNNTYAGATTINAGTLLVDGSVANSTTTVGSGATLGGHGTTGAVIVNSGGHLAPGDSPGVLTTGNLSMSGESTFDEEIGGTTAGSYDQVQVHGTVSLGGASFNASTVGSFFINGNETDNFTIIDNDGGDAVTGTFASLAEGATLTIGGGTFVITYQGGDGNDVVLLAANNPPVLSGIGDSGDMPSFTEGGAPTLLDTNQNATVADAELDVENIYAGATLTLSRHDGANPDDVFGANAGGTLDLEHSNGVDNVSLDSGATFIGRFSDAGDGTFTITFNGNATAADVSAVMQQLTYANASDNPPTSVVIDLTFTDGNGQPDGQDQGPGAKPGSTVASVTVEITQVDDAPTLIGVAPAAAYGIGTDGALLSPALGVFDVDGTPPSTLTGIAGATIQIANGLLAGDQLFVNLSTSGGHFIVEGSDGPVVSNISVQSNGSGMLVLTGQDTFANWQQVLDHVSYRSSAADPTNGGGDAHRTITWTINDGQLDSQTPNTDPNNLVNATILHFAAPPVLDLDAGAPGSGFTTSYTENTAAVAIVDSDLSLSDPDTPTMTSATIVLTNAKAGDALSVAGTLPGGIASFVDSSVAGQITLQLFNFASIAGYKTALGQIRFVNGSENPDPTDRDIAVVVSDGEVQSNVAHATVHIIPINDAPVVTGSVTLDSIDQNAGPRLITQQNLLSNASDVDSTLTAINLAISDGLGTLIDNHNGTWSYTPAGNDGSSVSFSYQVTDGIAAPVSDSATMDIIGNQPRPLPPVTLNGTAGNDSFDALAGNSRIDGGAGIDTITFNFKLVDATVSYVGNQVIIDGPTGSHTVLTGFEVFNFTDGTVNNNDGNPLVDDLYYYSQYHDVWNAHLDADTNFNTVGWQQGRNPDAFFNTKIYLSANPDVKAAGVNPLTHYDTFGWKEGRDPSVAFDTDAYLKANPDVAAAHVDPLAHFLAFGGQEGRLPFAPASIIAANGFDYVYYLQHNPDVAAAGGDPLQHYETFGWKEGRNPNAYFDNNGYLANYPDVAAAGVNPLDHYHIFGWHEGRDPSTNFDTTSYLAAYADVAAANIDPLKHFLEHGLVEGRLPFSDGIWG